MNDPEWLVLVKLDDEAQVDPETGATAIKKVSGWMAEHDIEPKLDSAIELHPWDWDLVVVVYGADAAMEDLRRHDFTHVTRITALRHQPTLRLADAIGKWRIGDGGPAGGSDQAASEPKAP